MKLSRVLVPLAAMVILLGGCKTNDSEQPQRKPMAITFSMLDGAWQLTSWNDIPLHEDTFCYVVFDRSEQRFTMYDNLATMYTRLTSGTFSIERDDYDRYILTGSYDYGLGGWNNSYEVEAYYPGDVMLWHSDNGDDTSRYVRIDAVPEHIISEAREM